MVDLLAKELKIPGYPKIKNLFALDQMLKKSLKRLFELVIKFALIDLEMLEPS